MAGMSVEFPSTMFLYSAPLRFLKIQIGPHIRLVLSKLKMAGEDVFIASVGAVKPATSENVINFCFFMKCKFTEGHGSSATANTAGLIFDMLGDSRVNTVNKV